MTLTPNVKIKITYMIKIYKHIEIYQSFMRLSSFIAKIIRLSTALDLIYGGTFLESLPQTYSPDTVKASESYESSPSLTCNVGSCQTACSEAANLKTVQTSSREEGL